MGSFNFQQSTAYLRDGFVDFADANLSIASSPVLYGLSVYTVMSANWSEAEEQLYIFRLPEHYQRLVNAAKIMGFADFAASYSEADFRELILELLQKNKIREHVLVRATIFIDELIAGTKIDGLKNALSVYVYPLGSILSSDGIHCQVSSWQRVADNMIPGRAKVNGSYVNNSLMKNEALLNGYDEAIALDTSGHVAEGTVANLFLVRDGQLITPDTSTDILEGITRRTIIELATDAKLTVAERPVDRTELYIADEVFMVGSSAGVVPILSIDQRKVGAGKMGQIATLLQNDYRGAQLGEVLTHKGWLTSVY
jgi:branched-chain amino acid aminotransferase